jgi:hypothetical protein
VGINYYHWDGSARSDNGVHIGKSSARRPFLFHTGPDLPRSWAEWRERLQSGQILDDTGAVVAREDFISMVEAKQGGRSQLDELGPRAFTDDEGYEFYSGEFS